VSFKTIVIIGGGFGGVAAARALRTAKNCKIQLIDRRNFHLFQPLLYQVAMAGLNPSDIAIPLRRLFTRQKNIQITLAEVDRVDLANRKIMYDGVWHGFDYLILACGSKHFYFGNDDWENHAPGLKTIEQATEIRRRVLIAFEQAEKQTDPLAREKLLTFVIVGGGPTGVELAGAIAEMASRTLYKDYRNADLSKTKVVLVEAGPRILAAFPPKLSQVAAIYLHRLGVEVLTNARASELNGECLRVGDRLIATHTIIWAAGVKPSSLNNTVATEKDPQGRILVNSDLSVPGHAGVFVIGDQAAFKNERGEFLPGIAPVAIQQGRYVGRLILNQLRGSGAREPFRYSDKGIMATIGRTKAVVSLGSLQFSGFVAWLTWVFVHIVYLMRFRNRVFVFLQWVWSYFKFGHGARLIVHKTWRFYSGEKIRN